MGSNITKCHPVLHQGACGQADLDLCEQGLEGYGNVMGAAPGAVVIASNFWDLANWFAAANWNINGSVMEAERLTPHLLHQWRHNMTRVLSYLKVRPADLR
jgi:hypothetical protein